MTHQELMQLAIRLSEENVQNGGGPFGAVIAKEGEVMATGVNRVTANNDPTAHAEVSAIREACRKVKNFKLDGCVVYSSCEPCPMCLSALYWAGISKIYYANTKDDAKAIDFDDSFIYEQLSLDRPDRSIPSEQMLRNEALHAFEMWRDKEDKTEY
jgi:tRNA(Arg) A34 adenosine deaminase TadA